MEKRDLTSFNTQKDKLEIDQKKSEVSINEYKKDIIKRLPVNPSEIEFTKVEIKRTKFERFIEKLRNIL